MFPRFPIAHAQGKADNTSENLLNEIRQLIYSLYQTEWILYLWAAIIVKHPIFIDYYLIF